MKTAESDLNLNTVLAYLANTPDVSSHVMIKLLLSYERECLVAN